MAKYDTNKSQVLEASIWLLEHGYFGSLRGTGGNVSVRNEDENSMVITPSSAKYKDLLSDDMCVVGFDLSLIEGKKNLSPSMESGMHSIIYQRRPDVNAVVHTHQIYGSVFAVINEPIPALFDEVTFSLGPMVEVVPYALSGSTDLVKNVEGKLYNNANATIAKANQLMEDINAGKGALGKFAKDEQFAHKLDNTVTRLSSMMDRLDAGEGTAGKLLRDPSLYNNADQMLVETRKLVLAIRENPKKYLTIRFKIF